MKRRQIFFTSDWHIGHANSIKFDNRPFRNTEEMHKKLIENFNKQVPTDGITYFLGDMLTCNTEVALPVISQLNGLKILIRGNHDKGIESCYNAGFDIVMNSASLTIANELVTLTHCPLRGLFREDTTNMNNRTEGENWHGENRHPDFSIADFGQFHLHGHIHATTEKGKLVIDKRQWDVGVPGNNYRPVHIGQIDAWIQKTKWQEKQRET